MKNYADKTFFHLANFFPPVSQRLQKDKYKIGEEKRTEESRNFIDSTTGRQAVVKVINRIEQNRINTINELHTLYTPSTYIEVKKDHLLIYVHNISCYYPCKIFFHLFLSHKQEGYNLDQILKMDHQNFLFFTCLSGPLCKSTCLTASRPAP